MVVAHCPDGRDVGAIVGADGQILRTALVSAEMQQQFSEAMLKRLRLTGRPVGTNSVARTWARSTLEAGSSSWAVRNLWLVCLSRQAGQSAVILDTKTAREA